jgi:energy-coupling factor transporter ATP-binding protein EcfA2
VPRYACREAGQLMSLLEVTEIHTYYGTIECLKGISLEVDEGEIVTLIGFNGAGKSTTLRTICGLSHPRQGSIKFGGRELGETPRRTSSRCSPPRTTQPSRDTRVRLAPRVRRPRLVRSLTAGPRVAFGRGTERVEKCTWAGSGPGRGVHLGGEQNRVEKGAPGRGTERVEKCIAPIRRCSCGP